MLQTFMKYSSNYLPAAILVTTVIASAASAHVELISPNGGETLTAGSSVNIRWMPAVGMHDTQNFVLSYSTANNSGPWNVIAANVPAGDVSVGSIHNFAWTVPNVVDSSAWVRVQQNNNVDNDYEDVSDASFAIAAAAVAGDYNGNQHVDAADYTVWRNSLGQAGTGLAADGSGNGRVDGADYNLWKNNFGQPAGSGAGSDAAQASIAANVPEPAIGSLLVGLIVAGLARSPLRHAARQSGQ